MIKKMFKYPKRVKKPRSSVQIKRAKSFRICCTFWTNTLNNEQRNEWDSWKGPGTLPFNNFLSLNLIRVYNDLSPLATPPPEV